MSRNKCSGRGSGNNSAGGTGDRGGIVRQHVAFGPNIQVADLRPIFPTFGPPM